MNEYKGLYYGDDENDEPKIFLTMALILDIMNFIIYWKIY